MVSCLLFLAQFNVICASQSKNKEAKGSLPIRKTVKKADNVRTGGEGLPQFINFSLILPGPQITWKWTMHTDKLTTKCHICLHTWKQGGLMCGIWDWQSTIVKDLNDSQDPKHTLFCRENAFVAIYALFSDKKCPLFTRLGGGRPKRTLSAFLPFFLYDGFPKVIVVDQLALGGQILGPFNFSPIFWAKFTPP